jgi:PAS domain S-box-containing protein
MERTATFACMIDKSGHILNLGPNLARTLGIRSDEALPENSFLWDIVAMPEERARVKTVFESLSPIERRDLFETTIMPGNGLPVRQVRWSFTAIDLSKDSPEFVVMGWAREDWPRMHRQMVNLSRIVEITSEAVALVSSKGMIDYVNQSFCTMSGYDIRDVMGIPLSALVSIPEDITVAQQALACFRRDEMWQGSVKMRRKDGSVMFVDVRVQPVLESPGRERRYLVVGADHSRQHTLERQIEELQRLESLGTLSNGLAHRFNNILAAISGQTELIIMSSKDEEVKHRAEKILESALKGKEVVEQLGLFGRKSESRSRLSDLVPVVRNAVRFIRAAQPRCVQIEEDIPDETPEVMANTGEIHQVMLNLLTNALEAVGAKPGTIKVHVRCGPVALSPEKAPAACVVIEVQDDGIGIPRNIQHRIFEPFFTTHGLANSSGMGLAITHGIVQRHGGIVQCESEEGCGALFRVAIPIYESNSSANEALAKSKAGMRGSILLVDKEGFMLDSGKRVLEDLGYEVVASYSIHEAEEMLGDRSKKFSLLITALHLNAGSGVNVSRFSRRARPGMPVLLCANLSETFDEEAAIDAGASAILRRPASREQLADIVGKLMDCNV